MKIKIALIFILIILITVLTFGAVVNADEYIIKPEKVNYYDSIYSATPGGSSFFDPNKKYNSFFSPYAMSEVKVQSTFSVTFCYVFEFSKCESYLDSTQFQKLTKAILDNFYLVSHNGSGSYSYDISGYIYDFDYETKDFNFEVTLSYNSLINIPSGTLGFYNVINYDIWGPIFEVGYNNYYFDPLPYLTDCHVAFVIYRSLYMESSYTLPILCTADNLVFVFSSGITSPITQMVSTTFDSNLYLNKNLIDSRKTTGKFGGVYDLNFIDSLSNSVITLSLSGSSNWFVLDDIENFSELIFFFEFGTLIPYSEDVGYSGGQNYGSWSSNSCDWYDIPCHLGNAIGYLVYEFPLTKPITTLFTGLVGYLDTFFDISSEFSGVEVIYGVLITMIVVGIVVALFKS